MAKKKCEYEPCPKERVVRKWCRTHYQQQWRGEELRMPPSANTPDPSKPGRPALVQGDCGVQGCPNDVRSKGLCSKHATISGRFHINADELPGLYEQGCQNPGCPRTSDVLDIDHDHACCPDSSSVCGECIRGVLCRSCNLQLGRLESLEERPEQTAGLEQYRRQERPRLRPFEYRYRVKNPVKNSRYRKS